MKGSHLCKWNENFLNIRIRNVNTTLNQCSNENNNENNTPFNRWNGFENSFVILIPNFLYISTQLSWERLIFGERFFDVKWSNSNGLSIGVVIFENFQL